MKVKLEFKLEDFWIGIFWKTSNRWIDPGGSGYTLDVWICFIPCLPLHITQQINQEN